MSSQEEESTSLVDKPKEKTRRASCACIVCWSVVCVALVVVAVLVIVQLYVMFRDNVKCCDMQIGCFTTSGDGLYDDLPMPQCPDDIDLKFSFFSMQAGAHELDRDHIPAAVNGSSRLVYVVHGYLSSSSKHWFIKTVNTLVFQKDLQVITVDWSDASENVFYPQVASDTRAVGRELGLINDAILEHTHMNYTDIWCIGHSLGAHVCGVAGARSNMARITGLDPAGVLFEDIPAGAGLHADSADLVDVIHTDGSKYGTLRPMGNIDFYPNGGGVQPRCYHKHKQLRGCSHTLATQYFINSMEGTIYTATHWCTDYNNISVSSCEPCEPEHCPSMGYDPHIDQTMMKHRLYFLSTE